MTKEHNSLVAQLDHEHQEKVALKALNDQHWEHLYRQLDSRGTPHLIYHEIQHETEGSASKDDGDRTKIMNFIRWPGRETVLASLPRAQSGYWAP